MAEAINPNNFIRESGFNSKLIASRDYKSIYDLSLEDFAKICIFRFGSIKKFGNAIGVSRDRANQILIGYKIPVSPEMIRKIANAILIDEILLTKLFDRVRREEEEKNVSSDN